MSALPRDLLKPRQQRLSEVAQSLQLQAGQSNSQMVVSGCVVSPDVTHAYNWAIALGEVSLGQALVAVAAQVAQAVPGGAATGAGQACVVNIEVDSSGVAHATAGAVASTGAALAPALDPAKILVASILLPASFTPATTALTTGMITATPYSAGNESPVGGF